MLMDCRKTFGSERGKRVDGVTFQVLVFHSLRFEDLTAMLLKIQAFWNVAP
jgi:hypothetical protein